MVTATFFKSFLSQQPTSRSRNSDVIVTLVGKKWLSPFIMPGNIRGKGVFETMLVQGGNIVLAERHFRRLKKSLALLGLPFFCSRKVFQEKVSQALALNRLSNSRARYSVWEARGQVHEAVVVGKFNGYPRRYYEKGLKAVVYQERIKADRPFANLKNISYQPYARAARFAKVNGFDEAVLLNTKEEIAEGSRTNIFWVRNNVLYTPSLKTGCLDGITRRLVLNLARKDGVTTQLVKVGLAALFSADEVFLTSSLLGLAAVREVDNKKIAAPGPITKKLMGDYAKFIKSQFHK
jgi:branched-chain amino acid aminotransferase